MPEEKRYPFYLLTMGLGLTLLATGCGKKGPEQHGTVKVTGTVKYNGNPVEGATVTFIPSESKDMQNKGKGNAAFGTTDKDGTFVLRTFNPDDGGVPGKYIVTVTKYEKRSVEAVSDVDSSDYNPEEEATATKPPKNELPSKYESIKNSDLNVEIKSGEDNVIPLELKD
jgi:hypothetical protein